MSFCSIAVLKRLCSISFDGENGPLAGNTYRAATMAPKGLLSFSTTFLFSGRRSVTAQALPPCDPECFLAGPTITPMGDRTCYREFCPACDLQVTITKTECPECGRTLEIL